MRRIFQLLLIIFLAPSPLWAATDPFLGQWQLDPARSKITDEMKVTQLGQNKYVFDFGGGVETVVVVGTDQPGLTGTTLAVASEGPNWKVVRKAAGRKVVTATWTLSKDGNVLTDDFTSFDNGGTASNVKLVYKRMAPGSGFAGKWVSETLTRNSDFTLQVRRYENDGLSFVIPSANFTINANFDGKDHPGAAGSASSARRPNAHTVDILRRSGGQIIQTRHFELSPDLKTLTMTVQTAGKDLPSAYVFDRV